MESYIDRVMEKVKDYLKKNSNQSVSHRWNHLYRVYKRSLEIAIKMDSEVNIEILGISALLHDIDEPYYDKENHVERSLNLAEKILDETNYPDKERVLEIISQHSSTNISKLTSLEAKILYDADKIDGVGAIGIARVFAFCGQNGLTPEEAIGWYKNKIDNTISTLQTKIGKEIVNERLKYVYSFFGEFEKENQNI